MIWEICVSIYNQNFPKALKSHHDFVSIWNKKFFYFIHNSQGVGGSVCSARHLRITVVELKLISVLFRSRKWLSCLRRSLNCHLDRWDILKSFWWKEILSSYSEGQRETLLLSVQHQLFFQRPFFFSLVFCWFYLSWMETLEFFLKNLPSKAELEFLTSSVVNPCHLIDSIWIPCKVHEISWVSWIRKLQFRDIIWPGWHSKWVISRSLKPGHANPNSQISGFSTTL